MATSQFTIPGAASPVTVIGEDRLRYRLEVNGQRLPTGGGAWLVPVKGGQARVTQKGAIPGFARLIHDDKVVYEIGAQVPSGQKALAFTPLLAVVAGGLVSIVATAMGIAVAILLILMNLMLVKNPTVPSWSRWVMPVVNAVAGTAIVYVIGTVISAAVTS